MQLIMVGVPSREIGLEALDRLDEAVGATAVGAGAGALVGRARDSGVSDSLMKQIGELIETTEAAPFILADHASTTVIASTVEELMAGGADVRDEVIPPEAQGFLREAFQLARAS